ncbi:transmembrane protein 19-like isoform X2 [Littorina saxatilis]|uniref:transmembrane protein 19-like isoform X2 n=1 Tax=Littorina saxatilis TaxID=31220 RepID=UPI0038B6A28E
MQVRNDKASNTITERVEGYQSPEPWRCLFAVMAPFFIAAYGLRKKSLCPSGALAGLMVGFFLTLSNLCFFAALLAFFICGSKATKYKGNMKRRLEDNFKEGGQRDWKQVVCNGGVGAWLAIMYMMETGCGERPINFSRHYEPSWLAMAILGSLACCCGDTFASEIGSVWNSQSPRLITTFRVVPRGTNGGVSLAGTIASGIGGLLVGVAYYLVLRVMVDIVPVHKNPPQWPVMAVGLVAGMVGSVIDSLLGALFQFSGYSKKEEKIVEQPGPGVDHISGLPLLDNHSVNLLSAFCTALVTPFIAASIVWPLFV